MAQNVRSSPSSSLAAVLSAQVTVQDVDVSRSSRRRSHAARAHHGLRGHEVRARGARFRRCWSGFPDRSRRESRPRLLVVAGLNPDHAGGILVASRLATELLDLAAGDEKLRALLARHAVEIIPCLAVDAVAAAHGSRFLAPTRTNLRPVDDDRDGEVDEDGPEDLDGDGVITQMRVPIRSATGGSRTRTRGSS